jgi:hypothetical protein
MLNESHGVSESGWVMTGVRNGEGGVGCPVKVWRSDGELLGGEWGGDIWDGGSWGEWGVLIVEDNDGEEGEEGYRGEGGASRVYDCTEDCYDGIKF